MKAISQSFSVSIVAQGTFPAWRSGMPLNQFSPIIGTDRLQGYEWPEPHAVWPGQERRVVRIISGYSGLVRVGAKFYSPAAGGHDAWQNVVIAVDMIQSPPKWIVENSCSDYVAAGVSISGLGSGPFYPGDGRPVSAQNYWDAFYIGAAKSRDGIPRIMRFADLYPFMSVSNSLGGAYSGGNSVKGYRIDENLWDSQIELANGKPLGSTWPDLPPLLGSPTLQSPPASMCQHPTTEVVYMMNSASIHYWLPSTGIGSLALDYSPARGTSKYSGGLAEWETFASLVDPTRGSNGRLICVVSDGASPNGKPCVQYVDLPSAPTGTYVVGNIPLTGDPMPDNCRSMGPAYDSDNDRYIFVSGGDGGYHVFAIAPTGTVSLLQVIPYVDPTQSTAIFSRIAPFPELGGIVMVPEYAANVMFMPTR